MLHYAVARSLWVRIVPNVFLKTFKLSGTSDNVIKRFRMPQAAAPTESFVDLVR
jgi:hypothetical protein